jgi:hypothetical protein
VKLPSPRLAPLTVTVSRRALISLTVPVTPNDEGSEPSIFRSMPDAVTERCICSSVSSSDTETTLPEPVRVYANHPFPSSLNSIGAV